MRSVGSLCGMLVHTRESCSLVVDEWPTHRLRVIRDEHVQNLTAVQGALELPQNGPHHHKQHVVLNASELQHFAQPRNVTKEEAAHTPNE